MTNEPKPQTLTLNKEFRHAYYQGKSRATPYFICYMVRGQSGQIRYGITTSKKIGNAVKRNHARRLIRAAVEVAHALGLEADEEAVTEMVRQNSVNSPEGITSICADLRDGRRTEVGTISGSVVRAAKACGVPAPTHELMVELIRALEERP